MATVIRRRGSRIWTAFFRDETGKQHCRSTAITDRKEALKVAGQYEDIARNKRTLKQIIRVIGDLHRQTGGKGGVATITVRQHVESWLKAKDGELADSSRAFFRGSSQRFLDFLGEKADRCLFEIAKSDIVTFRDHLAAQVSPTTTDHLMTTVKALFKSAVADGLLADDPAEFVGPVKKEKRSGQGKRGFSLDELRAVLEVADQEWRSMIMFGVYTGQRLRDLATLTWNNIDLNSDVVRLETAKTHRTMTIPIAAPLKQHIEGLLDGVPSDDPSALIHPRLAGKTQPALSAEFSRLLVSAGLRKAPEADSTAKANGLRRRQNELSFHSLRHSAVSMLHEAGIPMSVVLEFVGHSSASMSKKYTHTGLESLRKAASALPEI